MILKKTHFHYIHLGMYRKNWHLLVAFGLAVLPVFFILIFAPVASINRELFFVDLGISFIRLVFAFLVSVVLALLLSLTLTRGKVGNFFLPLFDVLQSFPTFAFLPLAIKIFGPSEITLFLFLVITMIWPILFSIISSQKLIRQELLDAAKVYGATGFKAIRHVYFPMSYAGIVTGSIVGLGEGWEAVVGAELLVGLSGPGLGGFFSHTEAGTSLVVFGVTALLLFIFAFNKIIMLPLLEKSHLSLSE